MEYGDLESQRRIFNSHKTVLQTDIQNTLLLHKNRQNHRKTIEIEEKKSDLIKIFLSTLFHYKILFYLLR